MLPFLKQRRPDGTGIATEYRKPDENKEVDQDTAGLEAAASDLIHGIHNKDHKLVAEALRSFFEICDAMPHVEGPHEEDDLE